MNLNTLKNRFSYYFRFTVLFVFTVLVIYAPYFILQRSFVWEHDSYTQHLKAMLFISRWYRQTLRSLTHFDLKAISTYSFSLGYGSDALTTLAYYGVGDPFYLLREELISIVDRLRIHYKNIQRIYIYTSGKMLWIEGAYSHWHELMQAVSGINIAPKDYADWDRLDYLLQQPKWLEMTAQPGMSNRLYIFDDQWDTWNTISKGIALPATWQVIGRKWDKEFKTPENEHFVRLPILY